MFISEVFYSIQGEGILAGQPSAFIRTSGCNLRCTWCDTPYTSWQAEGEDRDVMALLKEISAFDTKYVVITGGEPMISRDIGHLSENLRDEGYHITIETAATVHADVRCDLASLSPKLSNSVPTNIDGGKYAARHEALRRNIQVIKSFIENFPYQLKFVIDAKSDLDEVESLMEDLGDVNRDRVLLMPQGRTHEEVVRKSRWIAEICKSTGFRLGARLHLELYGNTRGT